MGDAAAVEGAERRARRGQLSGKRSRVAEGATGDGRQSDKKERPDKLCHGESHTDALRTKEILARLLADKRTPESLEQAEVLFREAIAGRKAHYGDSQVR